MFTVIGLEVISNLHCVNFIGKPETNISQLKWGTEIALDIPLLPVRDFSIIF